MSGRVTLVEGTPQTALAAQVEAYLKELRAAGRRSSTVNTSYGYPLRSLFLPFCGENGVESVDQITNGLLVDFTIQLREQGGPRGPLSEASIHAYLRPVNQFLKWSREQGSSVKARAKLPSLEKRLLDTLSRDEIQRLEDHCATERSKLVIRVLADTGIRVSELCDLRTRDLVDQGREHYLHIRRGKGGKGRLVPIPRLHLRLRRFAERGRPADVDRHEDHLFLGQHRRPASEGGGHMPLTPSGVQQLVRNVAIEAGIQTGERKIYPHLFRHSFITEQLRRGMNQIQLAQIVGHTDTTMIARVYSHLVQSDAYNALVKAFNMDDA